MRAGVVHMCVGMGRRANGGAVGALGMHVFVSMCLRACVKSVVCA